MFIIALVWCASVTLAMSMILCICWRKKTPKDEWQGLDGMVTQKNPDENVNHLPSAASCDGDSIHNASDDANDKRTIATNTRRSLPDIPAEQVASINWDPTGDNSSEHYATVGHYQNAAKRHSAIPNGVQPPRASPSRQPEEVFSPYERVKYDKIQGKEHPYAQLQLTTSRAAASDEGGSVAEERVNLLRPESVVSATRGAVAEQGGEPATSRRSSDQSTAEGGPDIAAAPAVAGALPASPDLPYMTPPVVAPVPPHHLSHFSGDSQDSSKGYTSISVREPLANIKAQTKEVNDKKKKRELDPHYSTVSDDSDDVYTTIPDPNNPIYMSESETYARIPPPPPMASEVNILPQTTGTGEPADPPMAEGGDQVTHGLPAHSKTHSRQASSSSSIANLGSPKPEKRQANSPLPPPPSTTATFDFHNAKNLDDLYAKVHKHKNKDKDKEDAGDRSEKAGSSPDSTARSSRTSLESRTPEKQSRRAVTGGGGHHDYETLKKSPKGAGDPGYEKIKGTEDEPGYASINGPPSISSSDPGYEVLKRGGEGSCADPNYEELRHRASDASDCSAYTKIRDLHDGYSVVSKRGLRLTPFVDGDDEPNYESMPTSEVKSNGSESDPNYESVGQNDPNYETVKDVGEEPPYERLDEESTRTNDSSSSCRNGDTSEGSLREPPYEQFVPDPDDALDDEENGIVQV